MTRARVQAGRMVLGTLPRAPSLHHNVMHNNIIMLLCLRNQAPWQCIAHAAIATMNVRTPSVLDIISHNMKASRSTNQYKTVRATIAPQSIKHAQNKMHQHAGARTEYPSAYSHSIAQPSCVPRVGCGKNRTAAGRGHGLRIQAESEHLFRVRDNNLCPPPHAFITRVACITTRGLTKISRSLPPIIENRGSKYGDESARSRARLSAHNVLIIAI